MKKIALPAELEVGSEVRLVNVRQETDLSWGWEPFFADMRGIVKAIQHVETCKPMKIAAVEIAFAGVPNSAIREYLHDCSGNCTYGRWFSEAELILL